MAKLGLVTAGFDAGEGVVVAVAIGCSLLTLVSMTKIWLSAFWGESATARIRTVEPGHAATAAEATGGGRDDCGSGPDHHFAVDWPAPMTLATVALVAVGLTVALAAGPLYGLCERAAGDLVMPTPSIRPWCVIDEGAVSSTGSRCSSCSW